MLLITLLFILPVVLTLPLNDTYYNVTYNAYDTVYSLPDISLSTTTTRPTTTIKSTSTDLR